MICNPRTVDRLWLATFGAALALYTLGYFLVRRFVVPAGVALSVMACGSTAAYQTLASTATAASAAIHQFEEIDATSKRAILDASGCATVPTCEAALSTYKRQREPILLAVAATVPVLEDARAALKSGEERAYPDLAARLAAAVARVVSLVSTWGK